MYEVISTTQDGHCEIPEQETMTREQVEEFAWLLYHKFHGELSWHKSVTREFITIQLMANNYGTFRIWVNGGKYRFDFERSTRAEDWNVTAHEVI